MTSRSIRTTLALPADLLEAADRVVRDGKARSRNDLMAAALRHELAALARTDIDASFAALGEDADHRREVQTIAAEFATADWEAFQRAESAS